MSPTELAGRVLQQHSASLPVNIVHIIRAEGIILRVIHTKPDFNGMYMRLLDQPFIYVNGEHPRNRQAFTMAHELYHHYEARRGAWSGRPMFDATPRPETRLGIREERAANRFAAALLMPGELIQAMARQEFDTGRMARRCGVSVEAMDIRLQELGLLRKATRGCTR